HPVAPARDGSIKPRIDGEWPRDVHTSWNPTCRRWAPRRRERAPGLEGAKSRATRLIRPPCTRPLESTPPPAGGGRFRLRASHTSRGQPRGRSRCPTDVTPRIHHDAPRTGRVCSPRV